MTKRFWFASILASLAFACGGGTKPTTTTPTTTTATTEAVLAIKPFTLTGQNDFKVTVDDKGAVHAMKDGKDEVFATLDSTGRLLRDGAPVVELANDGTVRAGDTMLGALDATGVLTKDGGQKLFFGQDGLLVGGVDKEAPKVDPAGDPAINRAAVLVLIATSAKQSKPD